MGLSKRYRISLAHGPSKESNMTPEEERFVLEKIEIAKDRGVKIFLIPSLVRRIDPIKDIRAFFEISSLIRSQRPDIVHTHTSKAGILGRWAAWLLGVPYIVHTPHGHVFYGHFSKAISMLFLIIEKVSSHITNRIVALSEGELRDYIRYSVSDPSRLLKIHSGVDMDRFSKIKEAKGVFKKRLGISDTDLTVGYVGWLMHVKAPHILMDAMMEVWEEFPQTLLLFVGKGPLENRLKRLAKDRGIDNKVRFLGWRRDIEKIMPALDVFALPSLNEGMGRVLVEAMCCGIPIVASKVGGITELVRNGENGYLVEPGNVNSLSHAIKQLLRDERLRERMGKRGKEIAREYSSEGMIQLLSDLYENLKRDKK